MDMWLLVAFIPAGLALNLTPGADMMFCLGQGLRSGPVPAMAASGGVALGTLIHVLLAGLGLGAVVTAVPWVFEMIRWMGVLYLLWLAYGALRASAAEDASRPLSAQQAFWQAVVVNISNPKVILFVLALLPQFVDPAQGNILMQFLILGTIMAIGGLFVNGAVGVFAAKLASRLTHPAFSRSLGRVTALIFALLALRLAFLQKA